MRPPEFWSQAVSIRSDLLAPIGVLYGRATQSRAARAPTWTAPVPVLCIGNVTLGGAGKTPVCRDIAQRLKDLGWVPHILSRGYGGTLGGPLQVETQAHNASDVGDEPLLLARDAPTWIGADRTITAKHAVDAGADILIMDDGFQNPGLSKTRSLLVFDSTKGVGNNRVFPAGPLREPLRGAFERANGLIFMGDGHPNIPEPWAGPILQANVRPDDRTVQSLKRKPVTAFAGIGRPDKFFDTLHIAGINVSRTFAFSDHHAYRRDEITGLIAIAEDDDSVLVTTEKDHVRLPSDLSQRVVSLPIALQWSDNALLDQFLADMMDEF